MHKHCRPSSWCHLLEQNSFFLLIRLWPLAIYGRGWGCNVNTTCCWVGQPSAAIRLSSLRHSQSINLCSLAQLVCHQQPNAVQATRGCCISFRQKKKYGTSRRVGYRVALFFMINCRIPWSELRCECDKQLHALIVLFMDFAEQNFFSRLWS